MALVLALFVLGAAAPQAGVAQDLFVRGGTLVDPRTETERAGNLLVIGGRVAGTPAEAPEDFTGEVVDAGELFVVPGFHDLHTHSFGNGGPTGAPGEMFGTPGTLQRALAVGVVGVLDLFSVEALILGMRDRQRADPSSLPGADLFAAGPCITATDGHCTEYGIPTRTIDSPEDARREIAELAPSRPDVVKLVYHTGGRMPTIDAATLEAAIASASEHGLATIVHVGQWSDAEIAVRAGATAITHAPDSTASVVSDDLIGALLEHGTTVIPTLTVYLDFERFAGNQEAFEDPLLRRVVGDGLRAAFVSADLSNEGIARRIEAGRREREARLATVKKMAEAGVPLLTGTDAGNGGVFQGYSVHREMQLFVEAGISTWEALRAASTRASDFLGRPLGFREGDHASFVLLEASPVADIANTKRIVEVIHRGVRVGPPSPEG
ncbi:MAG TPA: amidohydrolase family protein [Thermoanaerobaculia bacterium]|nr:amidohydrolase family protein [Thermoanaerobaculia bacterium]